MSDMSEVGPATPPRAGFRSLIVPLLITAGLLFLSRLVAILPVFGTRVKELWLFNYEGSIAEMFDLYRPLETSVAFGALGIAPYLAVCLLIQVAVPVVPPLRELARKGNDRAIRIIIWIGTAVFSYYTARVLWPVQIMMEMPFDFPLLAALQMVFGVFVLVAIGHAITKWGIGNGILLLLATQILAAVPEALYRFGVMLGALGPNPAQPAPVDGPSLFQMIVLLPGAFVLATAASVAFFSAQARLSVSYEDGERPASLPLPLWCAGILPLVTAQVWMMVLPSSARLLGTKLNLAPFHNLADMLSMERPAYPIIISLLVVLFTVLWSRRLVDHTYIANTLVETGGRIDGVPPGPETALYLKRTMTRLALAGGVFLMAICMLPIFINTAGLPFVLAQFTGGIGILIPAAVFLDTFKQIKAARM